MRLSQDDVAEAADALRAFREAEASQFNREY